MLALAQPPPGRLALASTSLQLSLWMLESSNRGAGPRRPPSNTDSGVFLLWGFGPWSKNGPQQMGKTEKVLDFFVYSCTFLFFLRQFSE